MSQQRRSVQYILLSVYFILFFWLWFIVVLVVTILFWLLRIKQIKRIISRRNGKKISVLYLEVFSPQGAGNRYRTGKWVEIMNQNGFSAKSKYVFEYNEYQRMVSQPESMIFFHMEFLWRRLLQCLSSLSCDIVVVRRELLMFNDYGNLFFEKLMFHIHPHLVLDFDDDISAAKREPREITFYGKLLLEHPEKFKASLRFYSAFITGSNYLKELLTEKGVNLNEKKSLVMPTCVDYEKYSPKIYAAPKDELILGWVGSKETMHNMEIIIPALNQFSLHHRFKLLVICDRPLLSDTNFPLINIPWSHEHEIQNLHLFDIGLMPLKSTAAQKGKCGFKLIQYMGCGVVSIATGLTVNTEIVNDNVNGFLVEPGGDWIPVLEKVFSQQSRFSEIGKNAFQRISQCYSFSANTERYVSFLNEIVK